MHFNLPLLTLHNLRPTFKNISRLFNMAIKKRRLMHFHINLPQIAAKIIFNLDQIKLQTRARTLQLTRLNLHNSRAINLLILPNIRNQKRNPNPHNLRLLDRKIQIITTRRTPKSKLISFIPILHNQNLLHPIHLDNAVHLIFVVVAIGVEERREMDFTHCYG